MKKIITIGRMLKGYRVSLRTVEKFNCYVVEVDGFGSLECIGGINNIITAYSIYEEKIKEIELMD